MRTSIQQLVAAAVMLASTSVFAQPTAFHYQGRLTEAAGPVNGLYDLEFRLYDAPSGGLQRGETLAFAAAGVTNGLFTVRLDFGAEAFRGTDRWLDIMVRPNLLGAFLPFPARQPILATPYAILSGAVANGAITSSSLADGAVTASKLAPGAISGLSAPDGAPASAVAVDPSGLVGIGTATPRAGLDITTGKTILTPKVVGRLSGLSFPAEVAASGNLAVVVEYSANSVLLIDVTNPATPVATLRNGENGFDQTFIPRAIALSDRLLAVGSSSSISLVDIADPAAPQLKSVIADGAAGFDGIGDPSTLAFASGILVVGSQSALSLIDVRNPASPALLASVRDGQFGFDGIGDMRSFAVQGSFLAIASFSDHAVTLVDLSTPSSPRVISTLRSGVGGFETLWGVNSVALSGNLLVVTADSLGVADGSPSNFSVTVVDIGNPAAPTLRSVLNSGTPGLTGGVFEAGWDDAKFLPSGRLAITSSRKGWVSIVDLTDPGSPQVEATLRQGVGQAGGLGDPLSLAIAGNLLIAASPNAGVVSLIDTTVTSQVAITTEARVGIGTGAPQAALHIVGDLIVESGGVLDLNVERVEIGNFASADSENAVALGYNAQAKGRGSVAIGSYSLSEGSFSVAIGLQSQAIGHNSSALGRYARAVGVGSTAIGGNASAEGQDSFAIGANARAIGNHSTAIGGNAGALGQNSFATGIYANAYGDRSTAIGENASAQGQNSFAIGTQVAAKFQGETVLGYFNDPWPDPVPGQGQQPTDPLFVVGNGSWDGFSNALTMLKNGNTGLGSVTRPTHRLELPYLPDLGGVAGSGLATHWLTYSDERLKTSVAPLPQGLGVVMTLRPVAYQAHAGRLEGGTLQLDQEGVPDIGFIAQEVHRTIPEAAHPPEDPAKEFWTLDYQRLIPVLTKAIQELKKENDDLRSRVETLERKTGSRGPGEASAGGVIPNPAH